jgi:putative FmdB family regulatory protein
MPIYEYRCKSCERVFEVIQQFGAPQLRTCKECKGRLEKLISKSAFHLKGGGWYDQGYAKAGPGSSTKGSDSSSKPSSKSKKSDSKGGGSKSA